MSVFEYCTRRHGMYVYFNDAAGLYCDQRISESRQIFFHLFQVKKVYVYFCFCKLKQKLGAISEFHYAVFVKKRKIYIFVFGGGNFAFHVGIDAVDCI